MGADGLAVKGERIHKRRKKGKKKVEQDRKETYKKERNMDFMNRERERTTGSSPLVPEKKERNGEEKKADSKGRGGKGFQKRNGFTRGRAPGQTHPRRKKKKKAITNSAPWETTGAKGDRFGKKNQEWANNPIP